MDYVGGGKADRSSSISNNARQVLASTPGSAGIIAINGKKYRIREVKVGDKSIRYEDIKHVNQEFKSHIEEFAKNAIAKSQNNEEPTTKKREMQKITLSSNGAEVNGKQIELDKHEKVLKTINQAAIPVFEKQEVAKVELKKHTFTKDIPSHLKATVIKVGVVALTIFSSPLILTAGTLIYTGVGIAKLVAFIKNKIADTKNLYDASHKMKDAEEISKFEGVRGAFINFRDNVSKTGTIEVPISSYSEEKKTKILTNKLERRIKRGMEKAKHIPRSQEQLSALKANLKLEDFESVDKLNAKILAHYPELDEYLSRADIQEVVKESKALIEGTSKKDEEALKKLIDSLEEKNPKDYGVANQKVLENYRAVLKSDAYQALKEDPKSDYIKLISHIAAAYGNQVQALSAYNEFGETVLNKVKAEVDQINDNVGLSEGKKMRAVIDASHSQTTKEIYTDHGLPAKVLYAFTHVRQAFGSLASEGGTKRQIAAAFGLDTYDSHGELRNNPSIQGTTECTVQTAAGAANVRVNNCYGGSPTIGDRNHTSVTPEFLALCQASENKFFAKLKHKDPLIPDVVLYNNLQDIENPHGEGERSFVLMQLNDKFPFSFFGITLAKDSDFYQMKGEYKNAEWKGVKAFGEEFLGIISYDKCYQYGDRTTKEETGHGIFLPGGKERWIGAEGAPGLIPKILDLATEHFTEIEKKMKDEGKEVDGAKLRGAYQEYVYSMIQAYTEIRLAKEIAEATGNPNVLIMAIRACKENIDRGGAENAKYIYMKLDPNTPEAEKQALVVGVLESRALSARDRTILDHRLPQPLAFIELVDPEQFTENLMSLFSITRVDVSQPKFTPALAAKKEITVADDDSDEMFSDYENSDYDNMDIDDREEI